MKLSALLSLIFVFTAAYFASGQTSVSVKKNIKTKTPPGAPAEWFFKLDLNKNEKYANVFSRAIAYHGEGFADLVQRVSGTAIYTVIDNNPDNPVFASTALYDGRPESKGKYSVRTNGQSVWNDNHYQDYSASGLLYNSFIWGVPPRAVRQGDQWVVHIDQPWELGGPGQQLVKVILVDKAHHTVTLRREGSSEGFYDNDARQLTVTLKDGKKAKMDIQPGKSHWCGYTTFKKGIIISDELLVSRPITLKNDSVSFSGQEREYILLNAMP